MENVKIIKTIFVTDNSGVVIEEQKTKLTMPRSQWDVWSKMSKPMNEKWELDTEINLAVNEVSNEFKVTKIGGKKK